MVTFRGTTAARAALCLVVSGVGLGWTSLATAQATNVICTGCIDSVDILDGAVTSADIRDATVTGSDIKDASVGVGDMIQFPKMNYSFQGQESFMSTYVPTCPNARVLTSIYAAQQPGGSNRTIVSVTGRYVHGGANPGTVQMAISYDSDTTNYRSGLVADTAFSLPGSYPNGDLSNTAYAIQGVGVPQATVNGGQWYYLKACYSTNASKNGSDALYWSPLIVQTTAY